ncbi:conserved unknown protein [Ectocarpus siliculosus]|uniref:Bromo domain-containing protein n=1 Tax=Ectocarpus siliculosus TaxID=2880 RepID=D7FUU3_ECTSI|nr:conserved unknown protein [Ectocarpus siliculosus]|eukprot:CBJ31749.1 conserved unknown protein [Ectocarpus siliculosus]
MQDQLSSRGGVDIMDRHQLHRYDAESRRTLRKGISHFLSPQLQVLIKEKPRIALAEKADFAELLSEERSGRCIEELSMDLMRRSFMIRKRVAPGSAAGGLADEEGGGPPVPPDMPAALQTTNKLSPAFAKKAKQVAKQAMKRQRPSSDNEEGEMASASGYSSSASAAAPLSQDAKSLVKPLISRLVAMKWPSGWGNPFTTVFKKSNAPPRYFEFIKRPMNLTFIRDNLNKNKYTTVAEVEADLELIVTNALAFNRPSDPVYQFALELQEAFRSELSLIKRNLEDLAQQGGGGSGSGGGQDKKQRVR